MRRARSSARLAIRHVTGFVYDGRVESSFNEARMTPLTSERQHVLEASLVTDPGASQLTYLDYFGTAVTAFDLHEPHERLEVTATSTVEVYELEQDRSPYALSDLTDARLGDEFAEYVVATPRTSLPPPLRDSLRDETRGADVREVVARVSEHVRAHVAYVTGSTHVTTTAYEAWLQGAGVCQDLSHVTIAFLRGLGVPARYVSGYLHPHADAALGQMVEGQSHAWVEYYAGEWVGVDPTNGEEIGLHHVVVARGRDYGDVPPLKGVYRGAPSRALGVSVEIARVA